MTEPSASAEPAASAGPARRRAGLVLPVWSWLLVWMAVVAGGPALAHRAVHGVVNGWHVALSVFLAINLLICVWEICLGLRIGDLERWAHDPAARHERPRGSVFTARVSPRELLSSHLWARVWWEYVRYDPGYADRSSFGFTIDVGNGWSTALPSLFFLVGMTAGMVPPLVLGLVGVLLFYQKLYGTCLYFMSFLVNRRYVGHPLGRLLAVVGGSNGIWLVFPGIGLYVCIRLIVENRFDVLWQ